MAKFFRIESVRKARNHEYWLRFGNEMQGPIRGYNEAQSQGKSLALIHSDDIEIVANDADGEFVVGIFTSEEDIGFSSNELLKKAYEESVTQSLGLKDKLLAEFDPDMIEGMAKMAASLTYFASQYKKLDRETTGASYRMLQKVYTGSKDYNIYKKRYSPSELCWVFHSWLNNDEPFEVIKDFQGIGMPDSSQLVKKVVPKLSFEIDGKEMILQLHSLAIGTLPSGDKFVVVVENEEKNTYQVNPVGIAIIADEDNLSAAIEMVTNSFNKNNIYRNRIVFINANVVIVKSKFDDTSWADIVQLPDIQTEMEFLRNSVLKRELLSEEGLTLKRGVLISGVPGIGKSVSIKCLCNELVGKATILVAERVDSVRGLYELASSLSPCIVIFEDIDLITENRANDYYHNTKDNIMVDLLGVLSGSMEYQDIITIATTNHPEKLDAALAKRPGRFDNHIKVPMLDEETKLAILKLYLNKYTVEDTLQQEVISSMKESLSNYTLVGAHIEDYVKTSVKRAIVMGHPLSMEDFNTSAEALKTISDEMERRMKLGFN